MFFFNLFGKRKKILSAIQDKQTSEVVSLIGKLKNINESFTKPKGDEVDGWTLLLHACKYSNLEVVKALLNRGGDLQLKDGAGNSPLHWGAVNENDSDASDIVCHLIEKGVDMNEQAQDGSSALMRATLVNNFTTLKVLLDAGADPGLVTEEHRLGALFLAASRSIESVNILLAGGADPNIRNIVDATPIFEAIDEDNLEIVRALVEAGADVNQEHQSSSEEDRVAGTFGGGKPMKPFDLAVRLERKEIQDYLLTKGAKHSPEQTEVEISFGNEEQTETETLADEIWESMQEDREQENAFLDNLPNPILDRKQLLTAVKMNGLYLEDAADDLKSDREIVMTAVQQDASALEYAADELKSDREIVMTAVQQSFSNIHALEHAVDELKSDREIVMTAVQNSGSALVYAADELKSDREIVMTAVLQDGTSLEYAAQNLQEDEELKKIAEQ